MLRRLPVQGLPPDGYCVVALAYDHQDKAWYDEVPWTRGADWMLTEHRYLLDLSDNEMFRWSVQVMRQMAAERGLI